MPVNLSVKGVPDSLAAKLRRRAERNHRSLQGELMAILEEAAEGSVHRASVAPAAYGALEAPREIGLVERLLAIAGDRGTEAGRRLTRDEAHDRPRLRKGAR